MFSFWRRSDSARQASGLIALVAIALAVRVRGIGFGLPLWSNYYVRPDETLLVIPAVELPARLGNPGHLNYPALLIEVFAVLMRGVHALLASGGAAFSLFLDDAGANVSRYFLVGRVVSACCGAALAWVVYRIARRVTGPLPASLAAVWYAVSPLAVREAHFAVTDTPMSLLAACALLAAMRVFEAPARGGRRAVIVCGCLAGAAVATKYSAAVVVPALAVALMWPRHELDLRARARQIGLFLAVAAATFVVLNPWLMLHPGALLTWARQLFVGIYRPRPALIADSATSHGWLRAVEYAGLMPGYVVGCACAAVGVAIGVVRCRRVADGRLAALILVALGWVALLAPAHTLPFRYLAPLLPLSAVLAGISLGALAGTSPRAWRTGLALLTGVAGLAVTAPVTWHLVNSLAMEDTRSEAGRWIAATVPASVPLVWIGAPESEPQIRETPASLRRRVDYVERTYGNVAARVIDRVYRLALHAPTAADINAYEVYRNPEPSAVAGRRVCVIQAAYPSPTVITDTRLLAEWTRGRVLRTQTIGHPLPAGRHLLEPWDAFFLPLNLTQSVQPGPQFHIVIVERDVLPQRAP
ncbi:MAG: glycosyltransferase family 39 protein [Acidobacteriota bacterium]